MKALRREKDQKETGLGIWFSNDFACLPCLFEGVTKKEESQSTINKPVWNTSMIADQTCRLAKAVASFL